MLDKTLDFEANNKAIISKMFGNLSLKGVAKDLKSVFGALSILICSY